MLMLERPPIPQLNFTFNSVLPRGQRKNVPPGSILKADMARGDSYGQGRKFEVAIVVRLYQ